MKLESKYNINQTVFQILLDNERIRESCKACVGVGKITLADDKLRTCPSCYGNKGHTITKDKLWQVHQELTIGQVRAKVTNMVKTGTFDNYGEYKEGAEEYKCNYMCYETGIDSGTVYDEEKLFVDKESAQAECDKRNESME